jgi:hypothetical protein
MSDMADPESVSDLSSVHTLCRRREQMGGDEDEA